MKEQVEKLLPLIKNGQLSKAETEAVINQIRTAIKEDASKGKELGQLVQLINSALKSQIPKIEIDWVPIENGYLAIGHKPGGKISYEGMKHAGVSVVLTLLQDNEGAHQIGNSLKQVDIDWIWFPFSASQPHSGQDKAKVFDLYKELKTLLYDGNKIYIHCSAGIHRTGMITYGFLRYLRYEADKAIQTLQQLREVTAAQVGEERLIWGDQFVTGKETY